MGIRRFRPTTPSLRFTKILDSKGLTKKEPEKSLIFPLKKSGGRNIYGRVTVRGRGGGHKRMYRIIDFRRGKLDSPGKIVAVEYDPNRTPPICLLEYPDGEKRYILAPLDIRIGDEVTSSFKPETEIKIGNCLPLRYIPLGELIHNIELTKGKGGQIVRSAGASAVILAKEKDFAQVKLPSGEIRLVQLDCRATIGQVANIEQKEISLGKAGRSRWLGRRPVARGLAMNPVDHPHGGGEGKSGQGNPHPVSRWGLPTKGFRTRKKHKYSDRYIIRKRK